MDLPEVSEPHSALVRIEAQGLKPGKGFRNSQAALAGLHTRHCGLVDTEFSSKSALRRVALDPQL